jgi:hypothetical protein
VQVAGLQLNNCSNESEIEQLAQGVLEEASRLRDEFLASIVAIDPTDGLDTIAEGNDLYDGGIAPSDNDNLAGQIGLPTAEPSELEEEARLEPLGLILVKGIIYARGLTNNIEVFRKLFFALGSNVERFLEAVRSTEPVVVVQTSLQLRKLPPRSTAWTVQDARLTFQNDAIEAVYQMADGSYYCVVPFYLGFNKSKAQVAQEFSVPIAQVVSQVFWLREVQTQAHLINRLVDFGITSNELSSILTEQPLKTTRPSLLESQRNDFDSSVRRTLDQIEFLNARWSQYGANDIQNFRTEIQTSLEGSLATVLALQATVRFSPLVIDRPEDIDSFLELNRPEHLTYLFAEKRTVRSIDFLISTDDLLERVRSASNIPSGSNTVSSILSNQVEQIDLDIDQTNKAWAANGCATTGVSKIGVLRWMDLQTSYQCLSSVPIRPTVREISVVPVIGYASYDAPASIMFRRADLAVTFKLDNIFQKIIDLAAPISEEVARAVRAFVEMLKSLRRGVDQIILPLLAKVRALTSQVEAFLSRHLSYFGTATLDSSILKCALGLDLRLDTPFIRDLEPFLISLQNKIRALLSQISDIVQDFLARFLCWGPNLLNDLLKGPKSFLPPFCRLDTFQLPQDLQNAMFELQQFYTVENANFANFSRNLLTVQAAVTAAPAKLEQFKEDLVCNQTPLNNRMMQVFRKDLNVSLGTNPIGAVSRLIPPRG